MPETAVSFFRDQPMYYIFALPQLPISYGLPIILIQHNHANEYFIYAFHLHTYAFILYCIYVCTSTVNAFSSTAFRISCARFFPSPAHSFECSCEKERDAIRLLCVTIFLSFSINFSRSRVFMLSSHCERGAHFIQVKSEASLIKMKQTHEKKK